MLSLGAYWLYTQCKNRIIWDFKKKRKKYTWLLEKIKINYDKTTRKYLKGSSVNRIKFYPDLQKDLYPYVQKDRNSVLADLELADFQNDLKH